MSGRALLRKLELPKAFTPTWASHGVMESKPGCANQMQVLCDQIKMVASIRV